MFSTRYPSPSQVRAYAVRAHRLRGAAVAGLIKDLARWISASRPERG
jgi:hypothetical protein